MTTSEAFEKLMSARRSERAGLELLRWARNVQNNITRGDLMLGILTIEDAENVPVALRRAAEFGVAEAWGELAFWLSNPMIGAPDFAGADDALQNAIQVGVLDAELRLAELRWFKRRAEASASEREQAYKLLGQLLAENDQDDAALHLLGLLTCYGFGTEADPKAAFEIQKRAAALGNANALFELYVHYSTALGVERNDQAAFEANQQAAAANHPRAMYNMGAFYATNQHVAKDMATAAQWYELAADAGNGRAAITLAVMYATGDGVEKDLERAAELFEQAEYMGFDTSAIRESVGL